jgi:hypothetical protein
MIFDLKKIYGAVAVAAENIIEVFLHFSNGTTGMLCRFFCPAFGDLCAMKLFQIL